MTGYGLESHVRVGSAGHARFVRELKPRHPADLARRDEPIKPGDTTDCENLDTTAIVRLGVVARGSLTRSPRLSSSPASSYCSV